VLVDLMKSPKGNPDSEIQEDDKIWADIYYI
jgi:hypothetical protein